MELALNLAKARHGLTGTNPSVGCVIVKHNEILSIGQTGFDGTPHAEFNAIKNSNENLEDAKMYVTLEPCSHYGRTPPCAEGLKAAGVVKVIAAMVDTNPQVAGKGLKILSDAGIDVAYGLLESQARALNVGFFKRMEQGLPYVICKMAASIDGKTALKNGQSKWITSPAARQDVQLYRAKSCAILTGADTVLVDDAKLNVRLSELPCTLPTDLPLRQPVRVIIDSQNRLTPDLALFEIQSDVIIFTTKVDKSLQWPHFVKHIEVSESNGKVDLQAVLEKLGQLQFNNVWLEAGATLAGKMTELNLVDEFVFYLAPKLMGHDAKSLVNFPELTSMQNTVDLTFNECARIGDDLRITASKLIKIT